MIDWVIAGALMAVLLAELGDAWALRHLARQCLGVRARSRDEWQRVRGYAEGFDHSIAITAWLGMTCLALTAVALLCGAQSWVVGAALVLAAGAHGERRCSAYLRRRVLGQRPAR